MTEATPNRSRALRTALLALALTGAIWGGALGLWRAGLIESSWSSMTLLAIRTIVVAFFIALGWREVARLFTRPAKNMGTGWSRVWAVARTTLFEAWAGRVWLLPVLWLICALILIFATVPFDESERIPLYIRSLLTTQEILVLVMMWVMACVSLPRERERKTLITTSSKPLSRLEIVLGKLVGFSVVTAGVLAVMAIASLIILHVSDARLRNRSRQAYELQKSDFSSTLKAPEETLHRLGEEGSLYSYNYITVPREGMSIGGGLGIVPGARPQRYMLGGSNEKVSYRFTPRLIGPPNLAILPKGMLPWFEFYFPYTIYGPPPQKIELRVSAYCSQSHRIPPPMPQEKTIRLEPNGTAVWEPDQPMDLFSPIDPTTGKLLEDIDLGEVTVEVTCLTSGVRLQILDGENSADASTTDFNVLAWPFRGAPQAYAPELNPLMRGFERRERQEIAGLKIGQPPTDPREMAVFKFSGSSLKGIPVDENGNFTLSVNLQTYKTDNTDKPTLYDIAVVSVDNRNEFFSLPGREVVEKRIDPVKVPKRFLGDPDPARRGDMYVILRCAQPGHSLSLLEDSVRIELRATPFFVNLLKSETVIFLEAVLLIAVSLACSVRLGWPVAMFCSGICVLFGLMVDFIASLTDYGGLGAINYMRYGHEGPLYDYLDKAASGMWMLLGFISSLVPNFTVFQPQEYIYGLRNMPWSVLGSNMVTVVVYLIPCIGLSYLMFRKQELG